MLRVVAVDDVEQDRVRLPHREVAVVVVHERRDSPVWVQREVLCALLLARGKVEVLALVRQPELLEHERDLPRCGDGAVGQASKKRGRVDGAYQPLGPAL